MSKAKQPEKVSPRVSSVETMDSILIRVAEGDFLGQGTTNSVLSRKFGKVIRTETRSFCMYPLAPGGTSDHTLLKGFLRTIPDSARTLPGKVTLGDRMQWPRGVVGSVDPRMRWVVMLGVFGDPEGAWLFRRRGHWIPWKETLPHASRLGLHKTRIVWWLDWLHRGWLLPFGVSLSIKETKDDFSFKVEVKKWKRSSK